MTPELGAEERWPAKGIWGAMPSAEYIDAPREGLDSYHIHRWLDHKEGEPYEQWYAMFAEKAEVEALATYFNALETEAAALRAERDKEGTVLTVQDFEKWARLETDNEALRARVAGLTTLIEEAAELVLASDPAGPWGRAHRETWLAEARSAIAQPAGEMCGCETYCAWPNGPMPGRCKQIARQPAEEEG